MSAHRKSAALLGAAALIASAGAVAFADDGYRVSKSMSHDGTEDGNPENEHAFIGMMDFYVPTQAANGTVTFLPGADTRVTTGLSFRETVEALDKLPGNVVGGFASSRRYRGI